MKTNILILCVLCSAALATPATAAERPKNVLLLIADDLNTWLLNKPERYTGKFVAPNLTRFGESGVVFMNAYTAAPVCSPSRTAFMSGVAPWVSGHYANALKVGDSKPLRPATCMGTAFKRAGYSTYSFGKVTHGWDQREGWDKHVGHKRDPAPPGAPLISIGRGEHDWGPIHLPEEKMNSTEMANLAIAELEKKQDKPFFLACGFFNPHMPWYVPQKYFDMFPMDQIVLPPMKDDDLNDLPAIGLEIANTSSSAKATIAAGLHKSGVQAYLAATAYVDHQMGRILDALEKSPYRDDTIVIFISDHGFHVGEKMHWQKTTLWEEATNCNLMVRVPGLTPAGSKSRRFVSLLDLYPTLTGLCEIPAPKDLDGRSLVPLLKNPDAPWKSTAITGLCDKPHPEEAYLTLRSEKGRFIHYATGQEEYYPASDLHEWNNAISTPEYAEVIAEMRAALLKPAKPLASALPDKKARKQRDEH